MGRWESVVPVSDPLDPTNLTFSEAAPLPDDAPDFRASEDVPPSPTPSGTAGSSLPRKRTLPGFGSRDNATKRERDKVTGPKPPRVEKPLPPIPAKGFAPGVAKMYEALSMAVTPFDVELGETLLSVKDEAAQAWDELARQNHTVRRLLVALMETTAWGQVIAAHSPLVGLTFARAMGTSQRQTLAQVILGKQAENYANRQGQDGGTPAE
jgi:hypothetical protein